MKTQVWAHRGASAYAPENTMPSFRMAAEMGADGVETDVHLTTDGELVICHDDVLDRVSDGTGPVCEKSLAELKKLDFSNGRAGFGRVPIVMLRELYAFAKETGLFLDIEMKYSGNRWDETNEKAASLAEEFGLRDRIIYSSFRGEPLRKLGKLSGSKIALLFGDYLDKPWEIAARDGYDALHPHFSRIYEQEMLRHCAAAGFALNPWTVDTPEELEKAYRAHVGAVITNRPDVALRIRKELAQKGKI